MAGDSCPMARGLAAQTARPFRPVAALAVSLVLAVAGGQMLDFHTWHMFTEVLSSYDDSAAVQNIFPAGP